MNPFELPEPEEREIHSLSPEARRAEAKGLHGKVLRHVGPGTRAFRVIQRTVIGTFNDGFIHAGNLAYLSMLAIFPFFILGSAIFSLVGEEGERLAMIAAVLHNMPPTIAKTLEPVARDVIDARSGWLLWIGAGIALWTVTSLMETIRDILRRAYGTQPTHVFWKSRLRSAGIILGAVVLLMLSLFAQVLIGATQQVVETFFPQLVDRIAHLQLTRLAPAAVLFVSLYLLFLSLTPHDYRAKRYPKWPGALFAALWVLAVTAALPPLVRSVFTYSLTYGSLAGIMLALFFFWLVGLGMVIGAELNAALAVTPEEEAAEVDDMTEKEAA